MRITTNASFHRLRLLIVGALLLACPLPLFPAALAQAKKPITKQGLIKALKLNALSTKELIEQIETRGVEFQLTSSDEAELRAAGARPEILTAARSSFRAPETAQPSVASVPRENASVSTPTTSVPAGPPLSKSEIITLLQSGVPAARVEQFVEVRGISFVSTPQIAREVMAAGGNRALVGALSEKSESGPSNSSENSFAGNNAQPKRGPDYDDLTDKATDAMQAENANGAIQLLQQAIQVDASKPTAYALLGVAQLYGRRNLGAAVAPMRSAIERGGAAVFRVYHDHDGAFTTHCQGSFFVTKSGVSFKADDGNDTFESDDANIKEAKLNALMGAAYGAFHVKLTKEAGGRNYNFAPATQQKDESQLITTLIQGY